MKRFLRRLALLLLVASLGALYLFSSRWLHPTAPPGAPFPPEPPPAAQTDGSQPAASPAPSGVTEPPPSGGPHPSPPPASAGESFPGERTTTEVTRRPTLRVAVDDRASALLFLALPKFIHDHEDDLDVTCVVVPDAALRWQLLAAHRVDVACGTLDSFVLAAVRHDPGAIIFEATASQGFDALVGRGATSLRDLRGKSVAVVGGSGGRRLLAYFLRAEKMLLEDVRFVDTPDVHDALRLLESGRVSAAILWRPYRQEALAKPDIRVLAQSAPDLAQPIEVCVASHAALADRKAEILVFMQRWFALQRAILKDPTVGMQMVARNVKLPAKDVSDTLDSVRLLTLTDNQKIEPRDLATEIGALHDFWRCTDVRNSEGKLDPARLIRIDLTQQMETETTALPSELPREMRESSSETPPPEETPAGPQAPSRPVTPPLRPETVP